MVFTNRVGGVSSGPYESLNLSFTSFDEPDNVRENRRRVSASLGVSADWTTLSQVHGTKVVWIGEGSGHSGDVLVNDRRGEPATILVADCVPVALVGKGVSAAVHAGWRGLCSGVIAAACDAVPAERAWIGPCIGPCHYEVGHEVRRAFESAHPGSPEAVFQKLDGSLRFDLRAATRWLLQQAGTEVANSEDPECTYCAPDFFSYRRDGETGRQALIIWPR